jgi:hypothetical protein
MVQVPPKRQLSPDYMGSKIRSPQHKNNNKVSFLYFSQCFHQGSKTVSLLNDALPTTEVTLCRMMNEELF